MSLGFQGIDPGVTARSARRARAAVDDLGEALAIIDGLLSESPDPAFSAMWLAPARDTTRSVMGDIAATAGALERAVAAIERIDDSWSSPSDAAQTAGARNPARQDEALGFAGVHSWGASIGGRVAWPAGTDTSSSGALRRLSAESFAQHVADLMGDDLDAVSFDESWVSMEIWVMIAEALDERADDPEFAARFFNELGPEKAALIPMYIEMAWHSGDVAADDTDTWMVLDVFSRMLATASHNIAEPGEPLRVGDQSGRLSPLFFPALLNQSQANDDGPLDQPPTVMDVALLFSAGGFSHDALMALADLAERTLPDYKDSPWRRGPSPWGQFTNPAAVMLPAIAEDPVAAASQPTVYAQLVAIGQLTPENLDLAMLEAARRSELDPSYHQTHVDEIRRLELFDDGYVNEYGEELQQLGNAVVAAGVTHHTINELRDLRSDAWRIIMDPRSSPRDAARAIGTVHATPAWAKKVAANRGVKLGGRALLPVGIGVDLFGHLVEGRGAVEAVTRTGGGVAGAWFGGWTAARLGTPLLGGGPGGWILYGGFVFGFSIAGALGADWVLDWLSLSERPEDHLWVLPDADDGLARPGPSSDPEGE